MFNLAQYVAELTPEKRKKLEDRFWSKVDRKGPDECWLWMGYKNHNGYGSMPVRHGIHSLSHRISVVFSGIEIEGLCVLHKCDMPACCNPAHLFIGTRKDNNADMHKKGRYAAGDRHGTRKHPEMFARGENHVQAKLSNEDVMFIKEMAGSGVTQDAIASILGVSRSYVSGIQCGVRRRAC